MLSKKEDFFLDFKKDIAREIKMVKELNVFLKEFENKKNFKDRQAIDENVRHLKNSVEEVSQQMIENLSGISINAPLKLQIPEIKDEKKDVAKSGKKSNTSKIFDFLKFQNKYKISGIEKSTLKRIKKKEEEEKVEKGRIKKPSLYVGYANKLFSDFSADLVKKYKLRELQADLMKANMNFLLRSYISVMILTTLISFFVSIFLVIFFLFFNLQATLPIVTLTEENIFIRFLETFWLIGVLPMSTLLFMYFYPSLEKDSVEKRVDLELPFATINMAAISGSLIDPTKMFNIIISTQEYPALEREFTKLLNSVNVLGQDFISALRNSGFNTASRKLSALFNGLATTINSGGDLPKFFSERAETMLFEYNLEREKSTKAAET
ncbi:MAG: type II secretion system F family protein, partial [Nanoarchaeota archaeon]